MDTASDNRAQQPKPTRMPDAVSLGPNCFLQSKFSAHTSKACTHSHSRCVESHAIAVQLHRCMQRLLGTLPEQSLPVLGNEDDQDNILQPARCSVPVCAEWVSCAPNTPLTHALLESSRQHFDATIRD